MFREWLGEILTQLGRRIGSSGKQTKSIKTKLISDQIEKVQERPNLNPDQTEARQKILNAEAGSVLFVIGEAGSGKSFLLETLSEELKRSALVVAPTGIAACNCGGATAHRQFELPLGIISGEELRKGLSADKTKLVQRCTHIFIDEVSMVRADMFDAIDQKLRRACNSSSSFGGKRVVCFGDFAQIPPVLISDDKPVYTKQWMSRWCLDARGFPERVSKHRLGQQMRQQQDMEFHSLLNDCRQGSPNSTTLLKFNERCLEKPRDSLEITARKREAEQVNKEFLSGLAGQEYGFVARHDGFKGKSEFPFEEYVIIKRCARVLICANNQDYYYNGDLGEVVRIDSHSVDVLLDRTQSIVSVERHTWKIFSHAFDEATEQVIKKETARFNQMPLRLGWAINVHKVQGLTVNKAHVNPGEGGFWDHGMAYVALSRVRKMEDLTLSRQLSKIDFHFDIRVEDWT